MAKVLVTGGAGFIGSNIVKQLVAEAHRVCVLDNLLSGFRINLEDQAGVVFYEGDVRNKHDVAKAIEGTEVIFHLAASVGNKRSIDDPIQDAEINVIGTLVVLEAARHVGVRKLIVSSSAGIFGELKTLPISEDHPVDPDSPYGCTKFCEETECLAYSKLYELEAVCLRYFNVYGPNQRFDAYGNVIPIFAFQMLRGETLTIHGDGEQTRDFVNVRDVAQANIRAAEAKGINGAFNIGSGTRITINHLAELLQEVSGIKAKLVHGPKRPGDVRDSLADISAASAAFEYKPTVPLIEGLREYMDWAKAEVKRT